MRKINKGREGESRAGIGELFTCRFFTWRWNAFPCYLIKRTQNYSTLGTKCRTKAEFAVDLKPHQTWLSEFVRYKCSERYAELLVPLINLKSYYYKWGRQDQLTVCFILRCTELRGAWAGPRACRTLAGCVVGADTSLGQLNLHLTPGLVVIITRET